MSNQFRSDHMANERTFLAWIRTSIGVMAFGFVVEKFALFLNQISLFINHNQQTASPLPSSRFSVITGMVLIIAGAIIALFAYIRFRITARQIDNNSYKPYFFI
ncbi:MAG: DUF202 domain-containing protein [Bacteroidetes bacterium]|nr:DUF202 domain-containing protein [Bacteroidota bacterium]